MNYFKRFLNSLAHPRRVRDARVGRDDRTHRAWAVIETGGHATKVNFMWDAV